MDAVVPYDGAKYQGAKFALILFQAECAIRELDLITEERLTDAQIKTSLEYFVRRLARSGAGNTERRACDR